MTIRRCFLLCTLATASAALWAQSPDKPVLWYSFDEMQVDQKQHVRTIENKIGGSSDTLSGTYVALKRGVAGKSLLLDGYSSFLTSSTSAPIQGDFTLEGWVALGAYPTNFAPLAEQSSGKNTGCSLGINAYGFPEFRTATGAGRVDLVSKEIVPLFQWTHLAATYDGSKLCLYVNGQLKSSQSTSAAFVPAKNGTFYCGVTSDKTQPVGTIREGSTGYVEHFIDGLVDEVKVWNKALDASAIGRTGATAASKRAPELDQRHLPTLPKTGRFGAVYANLKFYESWDKIWRVCGDPDVVVNFEDFDGHFVFWRGASYIPHWVTENGIWYDNEFCETWDKRGCHEPMSDKRCEFSQVKILESTPARCVVQWRYALIDNWKNVAHVDPITGWGDWVDEIYTIYPNGIAVRSQNLHGEDIATYDEDRISHEWHESILVMGQGQSPETVLYPEALTMANMKGEEHTYSWAKDVPKDKDPNTTYIIQKDNGWAQDWLTEIDNINIQLVNTRSENKPFVIIDPKDEPKWDVYSGEIRRDISLFPWWNHWPTSIKPSDGRYALHSDRASHSSLTHVFKWRPYRVEPELQTRLMLNGLTQQRASELVPVTTYWCNPPKIEAIGSQVESQGFDKEQMAYVLNCKGNATALNIQVAATQQSPAVNPAFVITRWNGETASFKLNGKKVTDSKLVRHGFIQTAEGINLVVWINGTFNGNMELSIEK